MKVFLAAGGKSGYEKWKVNEPQGLVAIFLLFIIFHIIYDYTIKGAIDEKMKF